MPVTSKTPTALFDYPKYWAECLLPAPFLPMSRDEMDQLGWDSCDVILVTGDAYVDHPSFGMAVIGRVLEAQGYRVWIEKNTDEKCVRCWHQREDVGRSDEHPELCVRCIENVAGDGEERRLA